MLCYLLMFNLSTYIQLYMNYQSFIICKVDINDLSMYLLLAIKS